MADVEERTEKMIEIILLTVILAILIYRCYRMETDLVNFKLKHNELARIVSNNAVVLEDTAKVVDIIIEEINQVLEDYSKEREGVADEN